MVCADLHRRMDRLITLFNNVGIGRARPKTVTAHPEFAEDITYILSRTTAVLHPLMGRSTWKYSTKEFQSVHTGIERVIRVPGGGTKGVGLLWKAGKQILHQASVPGVRLSAL